MTEHRKLVAIMYSCFEGHAARMAENEKHALFLLDKSRSLQKSIIKSYKGTLIKEEGENLVASFPNTLQAVSCAVSIQKQLSVHPDINLRIGIHVGEVIKKGEELLGNCILATSHIMDHAIDKNICISEHALVYIKNISGLIVTPISNDSQGNEGAAFKIFVLQIESFPEEVLSSSSENPVYSPGSIQFWHELNRRGVLKASSMFIVATFAMLEAFNILFPAIVFPLWLILLIVILAITGFSLTAYVSWNYEFDPEGFSRIQRININPNQHNLAQQTVRSKKFIRPSNLIIIALLVIIGFLIYPKIFEVDKFKEIKNKDGRISIAVLPFKNLSGDTLYNVWQEGLQNLVISILTDSRELSVRQFNTMYTALGKKEKVNYSSLSTAHASTISERLETKTFILGSILKNGNNLRINTQLVNTSSGEVYKTYQIDAKTEDDFFMIADSLSRSIKNYFEISNLINEFGYTENHTMVNAGSPQALNYFIHGMESFIDLDYATAIEWYKQAIHTDTNFVSCYFYTALSYHNRGMFDAGLEWLDLAYSKKDKSPLLEQLELEWLRALFLDTPKEELKYIELILEIEDQSVMYWYLLGLNNEMLNNYSEAIIALERTIEICENLNITSHWVYTYTALGCCYHQLGDHDKEMETYQRGLAILPNHPFIIREQAICAAYKRNFNQAGEYLKSYSLELKSRYHYSEVDVISAIGDVFLEANIPDSAFKYYTLAYEIEPENPYNIFNLAWINIDCEIDVDEGLKLIELALQIVPQNEMFLDAKGWGNFKTGNYSVAYELINQAWENKTFYDHRVYIHLQEVKSKLEEL